MKYKILIPVLFIICSCRKDNSAEKKIQFNWKLEKFYVNDIDATDSMKNITSGWFYSFSESDHKIYGNHVTGEWEVIGKNADKLRTRIYWSDTSHVGPFLDLYTNHEWDLDYDKLCNDDELWIKTHVNNNNYESHFIHL